MTAPQGRGVLPEAQITSPFGHVGKYVIVASAAHLIHHRRKTIFKEDEKFHKEARMSRQSKEANWKA